MIACPRVNPRLARRSSFSTLPSLRARGTFPPWFRRRKRFCARPHSQSFYVLSPNPTWPLQPSEPRWGIRNPGRRWAPKNEKIMASLPLTVFPTFAFDSTRRKMDVESVVSSHLFVPKPVASTPAFHLSTGTSVKISWSFPWVSPPSLSRGLNRSVRCESAVASQSSSASTGHALILGGSGRIGASVAADILAHTSARVTICGRSKPTGDEVAAQLGDRVDFVPFDLADKPAVEEALQQLRGSAPGSSVVVHCAGPFHHRDDHVLRTCIGLGINYVDVSDSRDFTTRALALNDAAEEAGVTAVINTGVFPGISNSMVKLGVEQLDKADKVQLSYVVAGSGGAGLTVMRTTFLGLQHPFKAWISGQWKVTDPYSEREGVDFPAPYGRAYVYWFEMPETFTLVNSFPVKTVVTKFGSIPDLYNHLTWMAAHVFPKALLRTNLVIELLSHISKAMTDVTDPFSGIGVAMRSEVSGMKNDRPCRLISTFTHPNTATACGAGTGTVVQMILSGKLTKPGVFSTENALSTPLFEVAMRERGIEVLSSSVAG